MYVKVKNQEIVKFPYSMADLSMENPQVSFPKEVDDETLASYGVFKVKLTPTPAYDNMTEIANQVNPIPVNGEWVQQWEVVKVPVDAAAATVRSYRDKLLTESDWTQLRDVSINDAAWVAYRQELRDISSQPTFPYGIVWPVAPQ
jgi:Phage tail assembly chaperone protein